MSAEPGTVTQASPLLVKLDTSSTSFPALHLAAYTPVLADRVAVVHCGSQALCLGKTV